MTDLKDFAKNCRKIVGAGINYHDAFPPGAEIPTVPVIFLKPISTLIGEGQKIKLPKVLDKVVNEVELAVIIGKSCNNVSEEEAMDYVGGYCLALDLTGMCIIFKNRDKGLPWDLGKCFDTATGVGRFVSKEEIPNPDDIHLKCWVNGELRQSQSTSNMVFSVAKLIAYASQFMTLERNDILLTGTPKGIEKIHGGDKIELELGDIMKMEFEVEKDE